MSDGQFLGEAWLRGNEIVIGTPVGYELSQEHNCDEMGCGQWHVLARFPVPTNFVRPARDRSGEGQP
jgi:hypothetical protein